MKTIPAKLIQDLENIKVSLYKVAYSYMQSESDALDIVSQSVLIILKNYKQLKNEQYFKTWATRIVINECKKELKRKKRYEDREDIEISVEELSDLSLKDAIEKLPTHLRVLIQLKYFQGYTFKEMSNMLDIPVTTLSSQLSKALKLLKLELEEDIYE